MTDRDTCATDRQSASWRKKALCAAIAVLLVLLVGELGLRLRQRMLHGTWQVPGWLREHHRETGEWHPFLRSVPKPLAEWTEIQGKERAVVKINSLGFRSPEIALKKPEGAFRVVCVGGSVVYDTRVGMKDSWVMRVQKKLSDRFPGQTIETINAGIPARTSADSVVSVALRVLPLSPDVVIVLHGVNDQKPNRYPDFRPDYSHWYREPSDGVLEGIIDKSLLACHVRSRLGPLVNPNLRENWRGEAITRHDTVGEAGLAAYRCNIEAIIGMCRARGTKVIIATVGHSLDGNSDWNPDMGTRNPLVYYHEGLTLEGIRHGFKEYNRVNREVAKAHGCALVDIEKLLPEGKENYQDDVHYTAKGAAAVAEIFCEQVEWREMIEGQAETDDGGQTTEDRGQRTEGAGPASPRLRRASRGQY
jgi:lysophospholipase L1-like esterase